MEERSITDKYLQSLEEMKEADPGPFFYTRLKGRMMQGIQEKQGSFKPAWAIVTLAVFLSFNIWMLMKGKESAAQPGDNKSSVQSFAETFNLNSNSNY